MSELINKRRQLTLSEKLAFIEKLDSGKNVSALAREFGIPRSTARGIVVNKSKFKLLHDHHKVALHRKRMRFSCYSDIEEAVYMWFKQMRSKNNPVNGPMLQQKAREFAKIFGHKNFEGSSGWLGRFRLRHDMTVEAMSGDTGVSDITSIGMTDEEIVSCINHKASLQSEYIVCDVDVKTTESEATNMSSLSNDTCSSDLENTDAMFSIKNKEDSYSNFSRGANIKTIEPTNLLSLSNNVHQTELSNNGDQSSVKNRKDLHLCDDSNAYTNSKTIESKAMNISTLPSDEYSTKLINNDGHSLINFSSSGSNSSGNLNNRIEDSSSLSKLSDAVELVKKLNSFFELQRETPQHIWNCLSDIKDFMLGDLSKEIKQKRITDYFKQC